MCGQCAMCAFVLILKKSEERRSINNIILRNKTRNARRIGPKRAFLQLRNAVSLEDELSKKDLRAE